MSRSLIALGYCRKCGLSIEEFDRGMFEICRTAPIRVALGLRGCWRLRVRSRARYFIRKNIIIYLHVRKPDMPPRPARRSAGKPAGKPAERPDPARVLTKALLRSAELLDLRGSRLATAIGVSEASISRMAHGTAALKPGSKEAELATLLVRCFRALDALVGGNDGQRRGWMAAYNRALNGVPRDLVTTVQGLVRTVAYLDHMRAPL